MNNDLLPCPCCGSTDIEEDASMDLEYGGHDHQDYQIICKNCNLVMEIETGAGGHFNCSCCYDTRKEAVRRWNTRD